MTVVTDSDGQHGTIGRVPSVPSPSPLPCLLPCPDPAAPPVAAGGAVAAVVPSARQAGKVAAAVGQMREVEVPPCCGEWPPEHGLAAVGAYVTGPVQP